MVLQVIIIFVYLACLVVGRFWTKCNWEDVQDFGDQPDEAALLARVFCAACGNPDQLWVGDHGLDFVGRSLLQKIWDSFQSPVRLGHFDAVRGLLHLLGELGPVRAAFLPGSLRLHQFRSF